MLDLRQSDEYEVISEIADLVKTNNLLVEFAAVQSGDAAEDDHDRLALLLSRRESTAVIARPQTPGIAPRTSLSEQDCGQHHKHNEQQDRRQSAKKVILSHGSKRGILRTIPVQIPD